MRIAHGIFNQAMFLHECAQPRHEGWIAFKVLFGDFHFPNGSCSWWASVLSRVSNTSSTSASATPRHTLKRIPTTVSFPFSFQIATFVRNSVVHDDNGVSSILCRSYDELRIPSNSILTSANDREFRTCVCTHHYEPINHVLQCNSIQYTFALN